MDYWGGIGSSGGNIQLLIDDVLRRLVYIFSKLMHQMAPSQAQ